MKKSLLFLTTVLITIIAIMLIPNNEQKNILYGERGKIFKPSKNSSRLFFDKIGNLYPNGKIPNAKLRKHEASLKVYYKNNPKKFKSAAKEYKLDATTYTAENFSALQAAIFSKNLKNINAGLTGFSTVYLLIHGFNKPIASHKGTTSSYIDNVIMKSAVNDQTETKNYFVEIYWDGLYDFFEPTKTNQQEETFKLFENEARTNAVFTGYGLRKIVSKIKTSKLVIVAHSLGARVTLSCLLNTYDDYANELLQSINTPTQDTIDICLIAPAIGLKPFEEYHDRKTTLALSQQDNYNLHILYNEEDFVLLKKWDFIGPGPEQFGDTTLGCNYNDAALKLKSVFDKNYPNSNFTLHHAKVGKTHLVEHYVHSDNFSRFLESIQ